MHACLQLIDKKCQKTCVNLHYMTIRLPASFDAPVALLSTPDLQEPVRALLSSLRFIIRPLV